MNPRNFFKAWIFFKNFDFNKMCKNEIEDNNEKCPAKFLTKWIIIEFRKLIISYSETSKINFQCTGMNQ